MFLTDSEVKRLIVKSRKRCHAHKECIQKRKKQKGVGCLILRSQVAENYIPYCFKLAKARFGKYIEDSDVQQAAVAGLMIAIDKFDTTYKNTFMTYATWWIRQSMQQLVRKDYLINPRIATERQPEFMYEGTTDKFDLDKKELIELALSVLSPIDTEVIQLRYFEGKSQRETSDRMKISHQRISQRESRALRKLEAKLNIFGIKSLEDVYVGSPK